MFAAIAGAQLLGERLTWLAGAGGALLLAAMIVAQVGPQISGSRRAPRSGD